MSKKMSFVLGLVLLISLATTLATTAAQVEAVPDTVSSANAVEVSTFDLSTLFPTPLEEALRPSTAGLDACFQCIRDCQSFPQPTRRQCVAWCYRTIPSCSR
ncbi:MAG: hypothetical protein K0U98_10360 [Deltaproteobacteria bacterium]|nr:hypothetical protein [Deltaproteobacteria bacterium]